MWHLPVVVGIAAVIAYLNSGCTQNDEAKEKPNTTSPPPPPPPSEPACKVQDIPSQLDHVSESSWKTLSSLWPNEMAKYSAAPGGAGWMGTWLGTTPKSHLDNFRTRTYVGAAEGIFRGLCEGRVSQNDANVAKYVDGSTNVFQQYFTDGFDASHESILVLIAGLAPASLGETPDASQQIIDGAFSAFVPQSAAAREVQFAQVLKAGYHYNEAAARAKPEDRYSILRQPRSFRVTRENSNQITKELKTMEEILARVDVSKLDDLQLEYVRVLRAAAGSLGESVYVGGGTPPPPPPPGGAYVPPPV